MKEVENDSTIIEERIVACDLNNLSGEDQKIYHSTPKQVENTKYRSKWIPSMKRKSIILLQREASAQDKTSDTIGVKSNSSKMNRRISLIPKRLSSNNFKTKDSKNDQLNSLKHTSAINYSDSHNRTTSITVHSDTSAMTTSSSDRHSNKSSSSVTEKGTIGKSISAIKKTFTLFSDSNSAENPSDGSDVEIDFDETLTDDSHSLRRTLSFTDSDRRQVISFVLGETGDNKSIMNVDSRPTPSTVSSSDKGVRQRSKTIDNIEKSENEVTGVLGSIANLVKINKSTSTVSLRAMANQPPELSFNFNALENLSNLSSGEILEHLIESYPIVYLCEALTTNNNDTLQSALSTYMTQFYDFTDEPLDFAMRKFLMINYLPKETQQIDRVIYAFAKRYNECNSHIGFDLDVVYILTYSITMVHTDKFNPNNKRKMSRYEFVENVDNAIQLERANKFSGNKNLFLKEVLGYFYDNITHCPLIKISLEQCDVALRCLKDKKPLPYPQANFSNGGYQDGSRPPSNATTTSSTISRSASQSSHTPIRKKSSSFLWSSLSVCDPYEFLVKNNIVELDSLRLLYGRNDISISYDNPFLSLNNELQLKSKTPNMLMIDTELDYYKANLAAKLDSDLLNNLWRNMTDDVSEYTFKIEKAKASFLLNQNTEAIPLNDTMGKEYYLTRAVKVGIIHIQETVPNSTQSNTLTTVPAPLPKTTDLLTTDPKILSNQKNLKWKPYFAILTPLGLFLFDDVSSFRMRSMKSTTKKARTTVVIEPTSPKTGVYKEFRNKSLLETRSPPIEASTFTPFSYFKSEKVENTKPLSPCLCLGADLFATRKFQNLEYDKIVNQPYGSNVSKVNISAELNIKNFSEPRERFKAGNRKFSRAVSGKNELNHTFFIYDKKSKNLCMVASEKELSSWIHSINAVNAFRLADVKHKPLDYTKVVEHNNIEINHSKFYEVNLKSRTHFSHSNAITITDENKSPRKRSNTEYVQSGKTTKVNPDSYSDFGVESSEVCDTEFKKESQINDLLSYNRYQKILDESSQEEMLPAYPHNDLLQHLYAIQNLKMTMPLQRKTKEELLYTIKIIAVKLEWMWYEKCKSQAITLISDYFARRINVIDGNDI